MAELIARPPCAGLLPLTVGALVLEEVDPGRVTHLAPYRGREAALSGALEAAHGLGFPTPGTVTASGDATCVWAGIGSALLMGVAPDPGLAAQAAAIDQTDGWASVRLRGAGAEDVLARLVPLDLRPGAFGPGRAARSLLGHMTVTLWREAGGGIRILAFRSMAGTLVHELETAMAGVTARAGIA